jgi:hypothetical protein
LYKLALNIIALQMALVRQHFPPATHRTRFSPERILECPSQALRQIFANDTALLSEAPLAVDHPEENGSFPHCIQASPTLNFDDALLIPKLPREAGHHSSDERDGYNLRDALDWNDALYLEVMVRTLTYEAI